MRKITLSAALGELQTDNETMLAVYREAARRLPPGPAGSLASSMAEQRRDLSKALSSLAGSMESRIDVELDSSPSIPRPSATSVPSDAAGLLKLAKEAEDADFERLSELAGAVLPLSPPAAEILASEASGAKKRAARVQDHLDLMSLSKS